MDQQRIKDGSSIKMDKLMDHQQWINTGSTMDHRWIRDG